MPSKEKKAKIIDDIQGTFAKSNAGVFTDYRGLATPQLVGLRKKLKEAKLTFKVVKNTLARSAAEKSGKNNLAGVFEGPIAVAFGFGSEVEPAKLVSEYIASQKLGIAIKGGYLGNKLLTPREVAMLATLPPKEVLIGKLMGSIQAHLYAVMNGLNSPLRGLMVALQARMKQMEEK